MKVFETLTDAIADLKKRGYQSDFNLHPEWVECPTKKQMFKPNEFHVDEIHRFEGSNDPDDSTILFAIQSHSGVKGILVDAYGAYASAVTPEMIRALAIDEKTSH